MASLMLQEAMQTPQVVEQQITLNRSLIDTLCCTIQSRKITLVMTIARGSSDHAATFAKYLFETPCA